LLDDAQYFDFDKNATSIGDAKKLAQDLGIEL
jgi:hypothetical protein